MSVTGKTFMAECCYLCAAQLIAGQQVAEYEGWRVHSKCATWASSIKDRGIYDEKLFRAVSALEHAVNDFERSTRVPLRGYTIRQPYADGIRVRAERIRSVIKEELDEILICLEPEKP